MKQELRIVIGLIFMANACFAQLPNGSTAPNWTLTDINGNSHTLYNYINSNKTVFIDFMATWCYPCWEYHNTGSFNQVYQQHSANVMSVMIEADATTNLDCLYDLPNCSGAGTWGNWVSGTTFPIINNASLNDAYEINYFPTTYAVCPDKKIFEIQGLGGNDLWEVAKWCTAPEPTLDNATNVACYGNSTGSITIDLDGGVPPYTLLWSNGATIEDLYNLPAGSYMLTVTGSLGGTKTLGPINITQPAAPLVISDVNITPEGCNGLGGIIEIEVTGGTQAYDYQWSNGFNGPVNAGLSTGMYSVTVVDENNCTVGQNNLFVEPPSIPVAAAASPTTLTCIVQSATLSGAGSSTGQQFGYLWTTLDGVIHSGANTLNNCIVTAPGTYELLVTNTTNTCSTSASTLVLANQVEPTVAAGPPGVLSCAISQGTLNGVGPTGQGYNVLWTTVGGNIVSGATTLNPVVNAVGSYTLTITNTANGCSGSSTTTVTSSAAPPNASASGGAITCANSNVTLSGSSTTPNVSYAWTGPNNFTSTQQNPSVTAQGSYQLTVTNPANGCTATATAQVTQNTTPPQSSAQGGTITCTNANVTLSGSSTTQNVTYAWAGPNNFTSTQQNPTVSAAGNYVLTVTAANGCTSTATGIVGQNTTPPTANAGPAGVLNCQANEVVLNGTGSSNGNQFSYNWTTSNGHIVSGGTTQTPTVDGAGSYLLTVSNSTNGCTSTASTSVVLHQPVTASFAAQTNVNCHGEANGSATAAGSGGNGVFTYTWSNGASTATAANLSAGTYTVLVKDGENCEATKTVTITEPTDLAVNASTTAQSAPGVNDGTATASPAGGSGNFTFAWSNGGNTATITGLAPGSYTVSVTDAHGCLASQTVTVNVFGCAISATTTAQDASCHGSTDGTASISLTNAAQPQVFAWSNGGQTQAISGLAIGSYTVTATDGNGCTVVASVEIDEPSPLSPNATATGLTATNTDDGTATANPTGGTGPFSFVWSNGQTTQTITGLPSANYTVSVTDSHGCTATQTVPVAPFGCSILANIAASNISCHGLSDGLATVTITSNLTPFTYEWSNGENTATISGLAAGTYTASVSDAVGCPAIVEVTIEEPAALVLSLASLTDADCGANNGQATVAAVGGTIASSYNFVWSNGAMGSTANGLAAGNYTVSTTDENGCSTSLQVGIETNDPEPPVAQAKNLTLALDANGQAILDASQLDNGSTDNCQIASMEIDETSFDCSELGQHQVTLTVTDETGNVATATGLVTVVDNTPPQVLVQNITVSLDENGNASNTPDQLDNGSADNCSIASQNIDIQVFSCENIGQNAVLVTLVDGSGNTATSTAIVTVLDNISPEIICPDNLILPTCQPMADFQVQLSDNCPENLTVSQLTGFASGSFFPVGTTLQTFEANDGHGNTATCAFTVTVQAPIQVSFDISEVKCFGGFDGSATALTTGGGQGFSYLWSNGQTTGTASGLTAGSYTVSVTDIFGCTATQSVSLGQPAQLLATAVQITPATIGQQNGAIDVNVEGGTGPYTYKWLSASGGLITTAEDLSGVITGTYTLQITDANGCQVSQTFVVPFVSSSSTREMERNIALFPNPASGLVTLAIDDAQILTADISVFDMSGKIYRTYPTADVSAGTFVMDFSDAAEGVYMVRLRFENQVVVKRLVIQH